MFRLLAIPALPLLHNQASVQQHTLRMMSTVSTFPLCAATWTQVLWQESLKSIGDPRSRRSVIALWCPRLTAHMRGDGPVKPGEGLMDAPWQKNKSTNRLFVCFYLSWKISLQIKYLKDHCSYVRNLKGFKQKSWKNSGSKKPGSFLVFQYAFQYCNMS